MSALVQSRSIAGPRAFTTGPVRQPRLQAPSNGSKFFMKRRDNYLLEVRAYMPFDAWRSLEPADVATVLAVAQLHRPSPA